MAIINNCCWGVAVQAESPGATKLDQEAPEDTGGTETIEIDEAFANILDNESFDEIVSHMQVTLAVICKVYGPHHRSSS